MTALRAIDAQDSVSSEIEIAAPPERVFLALTDPKQLFVWWGKEPSVELTIFEMDARRGGKWRFSCRPAPGSDHGEVGKRIQRLNAEEFEAHGELLEYDPPRLLVWSWIANWHEKPSLQTTVRWELTATRKGTRVRVTHSGLAQDSTAYKDYTSGWPGVLKLLSEYIHTA
ncbi:MAG TPA: SRPBCC domain-containing protein [Candidatus Angelobacter sp.]|nr:SRPBCC domain-containing protein [Candidatus Angelobacter sp.]